MDHTPSTDQGGAAGARRRRPLLASLTTLGVVTGLLGVAGVFAAGSDSATTGPNDATSGDIEVYEPSVDLQLATATFDGGIGVGGPFDCNDDWSDDLVSGVFSADPTTLVDGVPVAGVLCIRNVGDTPAALDMRAFDLVDVEVGCSPTEGSADATCGEDGLGELSSNLTAQLFRADDGLSSDSCMEAISEAASLSSLATSAVDLPVLEPNDVVGLCLGVRWDATDDSQSDRATWRLAFDAAISGTAPACVDDGREDDDDIASATTYDGPTTGQICAGDADVFAYEHSGGELVVEVAHDPQVGDLDVTIFGSDGAVVANGASTDPVERVSRPETSPGTYYVSVFGFEGDEGAYELTISNLGGPFCLDDGAEPNDTVATAAPFDGSFAGVACNGDRDYFRYEHPGGDFQAFLDFDAPAVDLDLALLDADGGVIASADGTTSDESIFESALPAGTYVLRVTEFITSGGAGYQLTAGPVVLVPPPGGGEPVG